MVFSSDPQPQDSPKLLRFLREKLGLSENALQLGQRQAELEQAPLPVVLWSFGLLTLTQYQQVLDWVQDQEQITRDSTGVACGNFSRPASAASSITKLQPTKSPPAWLISCAAAAAVPPVASKSSTNSTLAPP